ncbi:MAG: protein-disulfide reductase DsbD [Campylobacteraceae bacterium]|nr:protein-disulfide reductase DsbD [Campylobacteraceae bacterium]
MRKIIVFLFFINIVWAQNMLKIIPPEDAFSANFIENNGFITIRIDMQDGVYLLSDKFSLKVLKPKSIDLGAQLSTSLPQIYKEQRVFWNFYEAVVPIDFIKSLGVGGDTLLQATYQGCAGGGVICYPPMTKTFEIYIENDNLLSEHGSIAAMFKDKSFFIILVSFFGFGLLLSFTPCTFPMIPILSSMIAKQSKKSLMNTKKGFLLSSVYVFFMSLAYMIVGIVAGLFGSNIQSALQMPLVVYAFSMIFVLLAASMFGLYSFQMPSSLQNRLAKNFSDKHGFIGIAAMGFASSLIVGPCVAAPLAGALIYIGQSGDAILGGAALFVMSVGMGIPLLVIGASAGKLLPKPGVWMQTVQRVFGFIMLWLAVWMSSRILPSHVSLILYALLIIAFGVYIFALTKFNTIRQKVLKVFSILIIIYGLIALFSGINKSGSLLISLESFKGQKTQKLSIDFIHVTNLNELNNAVKTAQKPVMIEFTASWCAICTELEDKTFSQKSVQKSLENFILLKVDVTKNSDDDKEIMRYFGLYGPPAIVFFKNNIELKHLQVVGFKNEVEFLDILSRVENE